ncbi:MAG: hypothetical protein KC416_09870, partial [Myxococcales bacterium]|nr:hypothetical protein [Myxococcales bacterium]
MRFSFWALASVLFFSFLAATSRTQAQDTIGFGDGSDGPLVLVAGATTVNTYAEVTTGSLPGGTSLELDSTAGFAAGDAVMVLQTQADLSAELGDQSVFDLTSSNVGNYELIRVAMVAGSTLTFETPLQGTYDDTGAQVIRVPEYTTVTVSLGATMTGTGWNGTTGGVVAFVATGAVAVDGTIRANSLGFRGGVKSANRCGLDNNCTSGNDANLDVDVEDPNCWTGRIGESIDNGRAFGVCGIGNLTNGGGGGGHINAGGAGGGNGGFGSVGGDAWSSGADTGGLGGVRLSGSVKSRATFGGGGGGGQQNNSNGGNGGRGGGFLFIRGASLGGTLGTISADGGNSGAHTNDGGGGGGAGGTLFISLSGAIDCSAGLTLSTDGGNGTDADANHGDGGGGGGGRILIQRASSSGCMPTATQGTHGTGHTFPMGQTGDGEVGFEESEGEFGCTDNAECGGNSPFCNTMTGACVPCATDLACAGLSVATPFCSGLGACVECTMAAQCDDSNDCTDDACTGNVCVITPTSSGTACSGGVCDGANACVECVGDGDCDGVTPVCNVGTNTCVACNDAGDCDDSNDCTDDACNANACANTATASGTACGGGVCDGANACVECVGNGDCGGGTPFCNVGTNTCVACVAAGDCDDSNDCTDDACNAGMCANTATTLGTACAGGVCDGA